ncbi:uncharacterized protein [Penaeus vannamei]|uniref:uncharacterized protein n=1 Tax=Penaeus vannamei TaxID=6689 RepID=UPI00387F873E
MIEACEDLGTQRILDLANKIYNSGIIPRQMKESVFITTPKKGDLLDCSIYRLSLMSHIIKNKGMRIAIFVMKTLAETAMEMQKNLYVIFIDYEEAIDRVKHQEIMNDLQQLDLENKDLRLLKKQYWEQVAAVSLEGELSDWTDIRRGVRQGCVLSPDLLSLYAELIKRKLNNEGKC